MRRKADAFGQRSPRRGPVPIRDVVSQLLGRKGYAQTEQSQALQQAWREVAGREFAHRTRPGALRRGVLDIFVANSSLLQELTFQKEQLLRQLIQRVPENTVTELRFRIGQIQSNHEHE